MSTLVSLDIETKCGLGCEGKCEHALDSHRNAITVVGVYYNVHNRECAHTFRTTDGLQDFLASLGEYRLVGHNLKFDLKTLAAKGLVLDEHWADDTLLMAATSINKVSDEYLEWYERERARRNALLPRGSSHRPGSLHSLKTLAPFFLGVEAFWEDPTNHDNDEYVLKDCFYTYHLASFFEAQLKKEGTYEFYKTKLLPWTKRLLKSERRGVALDLGTLGVSEQQALEAAQAAKAKLDVLWASAYDTYIEKERALLHAEYMKKQDAAVAKLKNPTPEKTFKTVERYATMFSKAAAKLEPLNLDSPTQLSWLLKDHVKLDISNFHGDETTGRPVLQKLADQGREDIATFLEYRRQQKLATAFFPSYREMHHDGILHCSFNPTGTRTGRLSSSGPNLQQVPGHLHKLFIARPGYRLATYDMSAIEPRLIAFYTQDVTLCDLLATGGDFHGYNAKVFHALPCDVSEVKELFPKERKMAKEVGLSLFYGAGSGRLQETAQKYGFHWNQRRCRDVLERFKEAYEGVYRFRDEVLNPILSSGQPVTNLLGRQYVIDDPTNVHMQGFNTLIQSSASDLVINSADRIMKEFEKLGVDGHVLLLVHDEIVTEIPAEREAECVAIITRAMTDYDLPTPFGPVKLTVEGKVADRWEK